MAPFSIFERLSTSGHGAAGHDRPAVSVRSWSSCLITDMRRLRGANLDVGIPPETIARSARSLTDSDSARSASATIFWASR
jgi:hypothetical protein